jgi:hypothetical protein
MIEVVLFPKSWDKCAPLVEVNEVRIFSGKFELRNGEPQIIAEAVYDNATAVAAAPNMAYHHHDAVPVWAQDDAFESTPAYDEPPPRRYDQAPPDYNELGEVALPSYVTPIPPQEMVLPATEGAAAVPALPAEAPLMTLTTPNTHGDTVTPWMKELDQQAEWWIMVYMPRTGSDDKDRRLLRKLHLTLTSFPGKDRFTIVVEANSKGKRQFMNFAHHHTHYCDELIRQLVAIVGKDNIEPFERPR